MQEAETWHGGRRIGASIFHHFPLAELHPADLKRHHAFAGGRVLHPNHLGRAVEGSLWKVRATGKRHADSRRRPDRRPVPVSRAQTDSQPRAADVSRDALVFVGRRGWKDHPAGQM